MTGTREKLRSLFLVTLMVGSVFAGSIAFAGTAAAANNVTYNVGPNSDNARHLTDASGVTYSIGADVQFNGGSADVDQSTVTIEDADLSNVDPADVTVLLNGGVAGVPNNNIDIGSDSIDIDLGGATIPSGTNVTVQVDQVTNPEDAGRYELSLEHFDSDGNTLDERVSVRYKVADRNVDSNRFWQGQQLFVENGDGNTYELYEVERDSSGNRIVTSSGFISEINFDSQSKGIINTDNLEGEYAAARTNQNTAAIDANTGAITAGGDATVDPGETFTVTVQSLSSSFDSEEVEAGETSDLTFTSNRNSFTVIVDADNLGTSDLADIFSNAENVVEDSDDNEVRFDVTGDQVVEADFSGIDPAEYTFDFQVEDTAASTSSSIEVVEEQDADATIAQGGTATVPKGDVAQFPIELEETDEATVNIGYNNVNFNLTAEIEDGDGDGVVTPQLNLYTLGALPDGLTQTQASNAAQRSVSTADGSDSFTVTSIGDPGAATIDGIDEPPLDATAYDMNVTYDGNEIGVGTLQITEANIDSIRSWTAPESAWGEFDDDEVGELRNLVESGSITQSDSTAEEDVMVFEIRSTSVFGALAAEEDAVGSDDYTQSFVNLINGSSNAASHIGPNPRATEEDYEFHITQSNPTANRNPKTVDLVTTANAGGLQVVPDQRNGTLFVLLDTDQTHTVRTSNEDLVDWRGVADNVGGVGTANTLDLSTGERYSANFTIRDNDFGATGSDIVSDDTSIEDTTRFVSKSLSYDTDDTGTIRVEAAADQVISGTTTVAPGTELNLRIRSTGTSPFLESPTAIVQSDGSFNATVDFSTRAPNTTFEATARDFDDDDTVTPGVIGDAATASVGFADQTVEDGTVTVNTATLSEGGFIVIHDSSLLEGNVAGSVIGNSDYLESGENDNVVVELDEEPEEDTTLIAMAHLDTNGNEAYDFPDADGPYTTAAGDAVTDTANITAATDDGEMTETETEEPDTETETEEPDTETEEPGTETTTESEGPGFTAVLAVLAMLGAALLAARRRS